MKIYNQTQNANQEHVRTPSPKLILIVHPRNRKNLAETLRKHPPSIRSHRKPELTRLLKNAAKSEGDIRTIPGLTRNRGPNQKKDEEPLYPEGTHPTMANPVKSPEFPKARRPVQPEHQPAVYSENETKQEI